MCRGKFTKCVESFAKYIVEKRFLAITPKRGLNKIFLRNKELLHLENYAAMSKIFL